MKNQKKLGIILSYIDLFVQTIVNIFLTPMMISSLGDTSYSMYKVMHSFAGPLIMFNLGISAIVTRAIVQCRISDKPDEVKKSNTIALSILVSIGMSIIVLCLGLVMRSQIPSVYGENYSANHIVEGQRIFLLFVCSTIFTILTESFRGCVFGNERYVFNAGAPLIRVIIRTSSIVLCIFLNLGIVAIAWVDLGVSALNFAAFAIYAVCGLKEKPRLTYINKAEIVQISSFAAAILLQAIVNQVNNNVDIMILGAMIPAKSVITMYSSALVIYSVYNSLISVMANIFLPKATKLVTQNASGKELTDFVIKPGRYQAMIAMAIIVGFALLGKDFIRLWIGESYIDAYYIVLMLIIPVTIPLVENAAISILDASLKRIFRSAILVAMAAVNVIMSIMLIKVLGFWGAAVGTLISLLIGHVLVMNIYYKKVFGMEIRRMFSRIFHGILPVGVISGVICSPVMLLENTYVLFLVKGCIFVVVYSLLLWKYGLKEEEKKMILGRVRKNA